MKKATKSMLTTALILFSAGVLITLCSFLFVKIKGIDPFGVESKPKTIEDKTVSLEEILAVSPNSNYNQGVASKKFTKIDVLSFAGKVVVEATDGETYLSLDNANTNNLSYEIVGETLSVKEIDAVGFFGLYIDQGGLKFKGLRQIFGPGNSANSGKTVTLHVNKETELSQIAVSSAVGDVSVSGLRASIITAKVTNFGDITVKNTTITDGKLTLTGNFSNIFMENNRYPSCAASSKFGSVSVSIAEESGQQNTILDTWVGSVKIKTDLPTTYFKLTLQTNIGSVLRNGVKSGKALKETTHTASRISSNIVLGNISISYTGGNEENYSPKKEEPVLPNEEQPITETTEN